jgi:hypothetical protein
MWSFLFPFIRIVVFQLSITRQATLSFSYIDDTLLKICEDPVPLFFIRFRKVG